MDMDGQTVVEAFWARMQTNDWAHAATLFVPDIAISWPLSGEVIVGADNFVAINAHYPAAGCWDFAVRSLIAQNDRVVSEVLVSDGTHRDVVISFLPYRAHAFRR